MIKVGTNIYKGYRKYLEKGSPCWRKTGAIRSNTIILLVFAICILLTATNPVNAMVVNDVESSPATDQSATCPCKSTGSTQSVTPAVQPQAVDASVLNQLVQSSYSPSGTSQQATGYTPQYSATTAAGNGENVNTIEPVSVQSNAGTTEAAGTAPAAEFNNLFSQWMSKKMGSGVPGYSFGDKANTPMVGTNPMFMGWQMSPINLAQAPMQLNWLNELMW